MTEVPCGFCLWLFIWTDNTAGLWQQALVELQYWSHGYCHLSLSPVPPLTEVAFCCQTPPAQHWKGIVWLVGGSHSSALWCTWRWFSWGRWWWCSWSAADDGGAGSQAVSYSGARCCGPWSWWSACSVQGPGPLAWGPNPEWNGGQSHSVQMRCICGGGKVLIQHKKKY